MIAMIPAVIALSMGAVETSPETLYCWSPEARADQVAYERILSSTPDPLRLAAWHELFATEPHVAGTPGDARNIERMIGAFESMGLAVERDDIWVYLAEPVDAAVEIVSPVRESLPLMERPLDIDPQTSDPDLPPAFNAYSGSGDVTGQIVYANYGRKEDFEKLRELGIRCAGRIVIARYGGTFRGYKAKFAEEAGAMGLIIYTDPANSGYMRGVPYPEGGYANETSIQRGSIETLPYPGDPLTPFIESTRDAKRLDPDSLDLPRIPVQPVGWAAAQRIMEHMTGQPLPGDLVKDWQGGLPLAYRLEGGDDLFVRLMVKQNRRITKTANVVATLPGEAYPEQLVVLGCHHDAWGFGASDSLSGLIVVFEAARCFAEAARQGHRPARSIAFACWGAEEFGIIGSTEWCEGHRATLSKGAVAYINLDMASMGLRFGSSASPTLKQVIDDASRSVPSPASETERSVHDDWTDGRAEHPPFGNLGGGSDHIAFYCHLGIPSCSLGARGSRGTAYHTAYDTIHWYRQVVGDDYESARLVTRMANTIAARLANATVLPIDPAQYAIDTREHLDALAKRAEAAGLPFPDAALRAAIDRYEESAQDLVAEIRAGLESSDLTADDVNRINGRLLDLERAWLAPEGLPDRPWYRSLYAATDPNSGYAAWMLPAVRARIEQRDDEGVERELARLISVFERLTQQVKSAGGSSPASRQPE
jgi:N-acetylated-alpha-linked acidic dipeptidase